MHETLIAVWRIVCKAVKCLGHNRACSERSGKSKIEDAYEQGHTHCAALAALHCLYKFCIQFACVALGHPSLRTRTEQITGISVCMYQSSNKPRGQAVVLIAVLTAGINEVQQCYAV